jgi:hypothetical protein
LRVEPSTLRSQLRKNRFEQWPIREVRARSQQEVGPVSAVAMIVLIVIALLLVAMLAAAFRRSVTRPTHHGPTDDPSFRSHAEASRGDRRAP